MRWHKEPQELQSSACLFCVFPLKPSVFPPQGGQAYQDWAEGFHLHLPNWKEQETSASSILPCRTKAMKSLLHRNTSFGTVTGWPQEWRRKELSVPLFLRQIPISRLLFSPLFLFLNGKADILITCQHVTTNIQNKKQIIMKFCPFENFQKFTKKYHHLHLNISDNESVVQFTMNCCFGDVFFPFYSQMPSFIKTGFQNFWWSAGYIV